MWKRTPNREDIFYDELCNKYFKQVYSYCRRLVKGQSIFMDFVEECTQNTFLEARKQISKLIEHPNPEGWLYVTAKNLINNSYRSLYVKKKHEMLIDEDTYNSLAATEENIEETLNSSVDVDKLSEEILNRLSQEEYQLYKDYYKNNISVAKLSEKYDISATAMSTRIYRLKKKIKILARDYFEE